jgi:hypothetical protein
LQEQHLALLEVRDVVMRFGGVTALILSRYTVDRSALASPGAGARRPGRRPAPPAR